MCLLKKEKRTRELSGGMRQYKRKRLIKKKVKYGEVRYSKERGGKDEGKYL